MKRRLIQTVGLLAAFVALLQLAGCGSQAANLPDEPSPAAQAMAKGMATPANATPASSGAGK